MKRLNPWSQILMTALVCGCSVSGELPPPGETTSTEGSSTEAPTTGTSVATEAPGTSTTTGLDGEQCDPWLQDCPEGYKCMAYTQEDEWFFSGNKCTPVDPNPHAEGDPCHVVDGWWSGFDDCDYGLACWDINHDTNGGICRALCTGSEDNASCPNEEQLCVFWVTGIAHICLDTCDPLLQDCSPGLACLPMGQEFTCVAEYSFDEGQEFDPCNAGNDCDPGLLCWPSEKAVECEPGEEYCCLSYCDLDNPACNGAGAECVSVFDLFGEETPPAHANVGICVLPG